MEENKTIKAKKPTVSELSKTVEGLLVEVKAWRHKADYYYKEYGYNPYINWASVDESITFDLYKQKILAEEQYANNPIFKTIVKKIVTSVCQDGFTVTCNIPNPNNDPKIDKLNDLVEAHIKRWMKEVDAGGKLNLNQIIRIAVFNLIIYGTNFGIIVGDTNARYSTKFRGVDPKAVTNPDHAGDLNDRFKDGIEVDRRGDAKRLWVRKNVGDGYFSAPFRDSDGNRLVCHTALFEFHNQTHGQVPMANIHKAMVDLSVYFNSELLKNVIAAQYNIIFKNKQIDARGQDLPQLNRAQASVSNYQTPASGDLKNNKVRRQPVMPINPGTTINIDPSEEIEQLDVNTPNPNIDAYVKHVLRFICGSFGLSYEYMFCDWADNNFSSARKAAIDNHVEFRNIQNHLVDTLIEPLLNAFLREMLSKKIVTDVDELTLMESIKIVPPMMPLLDPQKEIAAQALAIENNFTTLQEATTKLGAGDYLHNLQQRGREIKEAKQFGAEIEPNVPGEPGAPAGENSTRS